MGRSFADLAQAPVRSKGEDVIAFDKFPHGLNLVLPATQLEKTELSSALNITYTVSGAVETCKPIIKYSNTATIGNSPIKKMLDGNIGGTFYELIADANYKIYYYDGSLDPALIGTAEGDVSFLNYKGVVVVFDGSFIKYLDSISGIKIAYDDGSGDSGFQTDNRAGDDESFLALGNGTNTRVACKFTSQAWTASYTIPPTTVYAKLEKEGNGFTGTDNVPIVAKLRLVSDDSILATKTFKSKAGDISATATLYSVTFESSDITTEMSRSIPYYVTMEYANGDATHYIKVRCTDIDDASGTAYHYDGTWNANTGKTAIMALKPGMPPKGAFGTVCDSRIWVGGDPDHKGYIWYGNLTHLDWSSADGGGYIGVIDSNANNFEVGGIESLYGDLYVFGTEGQPYIAKRTGSSPSEYALPGIFQRSWTTPGGIISTANDIWACSREGAHSVQGVEEYGDIRTFSEAEAIRPLFEDYWHEDAVVGYHPKGGRLWVYFPTYRRSLICGIRAPAQNPRQTGVIFPWSEREITKNIFTSSDYGWYASGSGTNEFYLKTAAGGDPSLLQPDFVLLDGSFSLTEGTAGSLSNHEWDYGDNDTLGYSTIYFRDEAGNPDDTGIELRDILAPQSFAAHDGAFFIGGSDGFKYKIDDDEYRDMEEHHLLYEVKTAFVQLPFASVCLSKYQFDIAGETGGQITLNIYKDGGQRTPVASYIKNLPIDDRLLVSDLDMAVEDALFSISASDFLVWETIDINARSFQVEICDIHLSGNPIFINGLFFKYRPLSV